MPVYVIFPRFATLLSFSWLAFYIFHLTCISKFVIDERSMR